MAVLEAALWNLPPELVSREISPNLDAPSLLALALVSKDFYLLLAHDKKMQEVLGTRILQESILRGHSALLNWALDELCLELDLFSYLAMQACSSVAVSEVLFRVPVPKDFHIVPKHIVFSGYFHLLRTIIKSGSASPRLLKVGINILDSLFLSCPDPLGTEIRKINNFEFDLFRKIVSQLDRWSNVRTTLETLTLPFPEECFEFAVPSSELSESQRSLRSRLVLLLNMSFMTDSNGVSTFLQILIEHADEIPAMILTRKALGTLVRVPWSAEVEQNLREILVKRRNTLLPGNMHAMDQYFLLKAITLRNFSAAEFFFLNVTPSVDGNESYRINILTSCALLWSTAAFTNSPILNRYSNEFSEQLQRIVSQHRVCVITNALVFSRTSPLTYFLEKHVPLSTDLPGVLFAWQTELFNPIRHPNIDREQLIELFTALTILATEKPKFPIEAVANQFRLQWFPQIFYFPDILDLILCRGVNEVNRYFLTDFMDKLEEHLTTIAKTVNFFPKSLFLRCFEKIVPLVEQSRRNAPPREDPDPTNPDTPLQRRASLTEQLGDVLSSFLERYPAPSKFRELLCELYELYGVPHVPS